MKAVFALALVSLVGLADAEVSTDYNSEILDLINEKRDGGNIARVCLNTKVIDAAKAHANDMAAHDYVDLQGSDGSFPADRLTKQKFNGNIIAELVGHGEDRAVNMLKVWEKNSDDILLNPNYNRIGIGYAHNSSQSYKDFWVIDFATSKDEACI